MLEKVLGLLVAKERLKADPKAMFLPNLLSIFISDLIFFIIPEECREKREKIYLLENSDSKITHRGIDSQLPHREGARKLLWPIKFEVAVTS